MAQQAGPITVVEIKLGSIAERLSAARDDAGLSQAELARRAGVSQSTIGNIESGLRKNPRELLAIAEAAGVRAEWLKSGLGPRLRGGGTAQADLAEVRHRPRNQRPVPVVGRTQGGMPERIWGDGDFPLGVTDEYAEVSTPDELAFVCQVVGDSMVSRYMPGEYALVEPSTQPELEDDVLVRLASGETMLKRLLGRRGGVRLGSYNTPEVMTFREEEITWMYYVAHPVPARRIKHRIETDGYSGPDRRFRDDAAAAEHQRWLGEAVHSEASRPADPFLGGESAFGRLDEAAPRRRKGEE